MSKIEGIDKELSRIVLGTMIVSDAEKERSFELLDAAWDCGINTFDTAVVYGSEPCLGMWLEERGHRDQAVVLSKGCHHSAFRKRVTPFDLASDIHDGLAKLRTDYIDIYLLHRDDPELSVGPMVEAFNEHLQAGRVKVFGISNWTHQRIQEANEYAEKHNLVPFMVNSPNYGLAEQVNDPWGPGCVTISGPQNDDAREWFTENQMPIFAYSSLGRGLFSGRFSRENYEEVADNACQNAYCHEVNFTRLDRAKELAEEKGASVPQIALAFILNQPLNVYALVGAANREECEANVAAGEIKLTPEELAWLDLKADSR